MNLLNAKSETSDPFTQRDVILLFQLYEFMFNFKERRTKMDLVSAQIISTIEVPGYSGKAVMVKSGAGIRLTDLCGSQIGDIFAISAEDHFEFLSPSQTRLFVKKLFPSVGE